MKRTSIKDRIAALEQLSVKALAGEYERLFGVPPESESQDEIRRKVADKLRDKPVKGAAKSTPQNSAKPVERGAAKEKAETPKKDSPFLRDPRLPAVGETIEKEIKGKTRKVTVRENGLEYEGRLYRSLSRIACEILGCSANGYLTFGLAKRPAAKAPAEKTAAEKPAAAKPSTKAAKAPKAAKRAAKKSK